LNEPPKTPIVSGFSSSETGEEEEEEEEEEEDMVERIDTHMATVPYYCTWYIR
jgi:hypothetical protein